MTQVSFSEKRNEQVDHCEMTRMTYLPVQKLDAKSVQFEKVTWL
jgi:hypothetical protein